MDLELRHLRVVCAIANAGSVSRAAAVLALSQPALTAQLQRIERAVGGELFLRDRRGTEPTALGEFVLARARAVLPAVDELQREARRVAANGRGASRVRILAVPGPIVAGLVKRLRAALPGAEITTELGHSTGRMIELVASDVADCAVIGEAPGYEHPPAPGVECHTVVTEPIFALLPEAHRLAGADEVELGALTREPWVLPPLSDDRMWEALRAITSEAEQVPTVAYQADGGLLVDLVRAGEAVALVQPTIAEHPGVVVRPLAGAPVRWRQQIAWRRPSPLAADLARFAAEAYLDAVARSPAYRGWCARHGVDPHRDLLER